MTAAVSNPWELGARLEKCTRVLETLNDDIRGEFGAEVLARADESTWAWIAERAGVRPLSPYSRKLVIEAVRRRGSR